LLTGGGALPGPDGGIEEVHRLMDGGDRPGTGKLNKMKSLAKLVGILDLTFKNFQTKTEIFVKKERQIKMFLLKIEEKNL